MSTAAQLCVIFPFKSCATGEWTWNFAQFSEMALFNCSYITSC